MTRLLVNQAKKGDSDAFCRLMEEQMQNMYKIARAYVHNEEDVADVIQDTIITCFEKLPTLENDRYFKTWLARILINKCKNMLQLKKRVVYMDAPPESTFYERGYDSMEWYQVLKPLDEKYRTILLLYYLEGFNTREISSILDMKESTVKSRLKRGREKIALEYQDLIKEDMKCGQRSSGMNTL